MSVLSSLLARDQVVPVKKIEEAIQRQVISGGELPTVLLEVGAAGENAIAAYHAASLGLVPASRDDVMGVGPEIVRVLPRALAELHQVVPLAVEANALVVAAANPPSSGAIDALAEGTGRRIVVRIVTEPRIAAAMQAHYQVTPTARMRRLVTKLAALDAGEITQVSPLLDNRFERLSSPPAAGSARPSAVSSWMRASTAGEAAEPTATATVTAGADASERASAASAAGAPLSGSNARSRPGQGSSSGTTRAAVVTVGVARVVGVGASPAAARTNDASAGRPSTVSAYSHGRGSAPEAAPQPSPVAATEGAVASDTSSDAPAAQPLSPSATADQALAARSTPPPANRPRTSDAPSAPISLGRPLDADEAVAALADADSRDAILAIAFAHAQTHFEYCAIFSARDDEAEGLDAHGDGASADVVRGITIDLERPGTARDVRQLMGAKAGVLDATEADRDLVARLERTAKQPSVIVPVAIRQRLVLLIYGDLGGRPLGIGDLGDLMSFLQRVSDALQRLILQRKRSSGRSSPAGPVAWTKPSGAPVAAAGAESSETPEASEAASADRDSDAPAEARAPKAEVERPAEFDLLRVPRRAPLPPEVSGDRPPTSPRQSTSQADADATSAPESAAQPASAATTRQPSVIPGKPTEQSTYRVVGGGEEEVILTRRKGRKSQRPSSRPSDAASHASAESTGPDTEPSPPDAGGTPVVTIPKAAGIPIEARQDAAGGSDFDGDGDDDGDDDGPSIEMNEASAAPESDATIITDMGLDLDDLVDALIASAGSSRDASEALVSDLVGFGEPALRVLARRFPGPLAAPRPGPEGPHPRARDASPVIAAMIAFRHLAVPHVVALLDHRDAEVRYFATLLAGEVLHRDLVVRIGRRVLDDDAGVRSVAVAALRSAKRFEAEVAEVLAHFRRVGGNDRAPSTLRRLAIELLGELRDADALSVLTDVLAENDAELQRTAHRALVRITKQDLGTGAAAWEAWVARSGSGHRIEWLIDAITHDDDTLRREAGDELKTLTKEYFGFQSALPRKELEVVQRKYRKWWDTIGRARFVRH